MDIISLIIGLAIGFVLTYIVFRATHSKSEVSKTEYEGLRIRFEETHTQSKILESQLFFQKESTAEMTRLSAGKDMELLKMQGHISSLETNVANREQKIEELTSSLLEYRQQNVDFQKDNSLLAAQKETLTDKYTSLKEQYSRLTEQCTDLSAQLQELHKENSTLSANNAALKEKLSLHKEEMIEIQKTAHLQFEKIAHQILEDKAGKFTESNKQNIEALLKPLGENIDTFKKKVEETYDKESKQRFSLEEKVKELVEQTNKVSHEANNLASALKGQAKKQGNWGEMILESILQQSGLVKNREYFLQSTVKNEEGKSLRPDVLIRLPDQRIIIIDSKVSLVAYDRYCSADDKETQDLHLGTHLKSLYAHIDNLQGKAYDHIEESLDFTMMFVPIEPAYLIAIQHDPELWSYAYSKRILLISPTNLIACLKLMTDLWKRELQSKNAMEIVKRGELLYEKFVSFATTIEDLGRHINKTEQAYKTAVGQLNTGNGHLIGQALKLKNLGLKSSKEIPSALLPDDFDTATLEQPEVFSEESKK